MKKLIPLLMLCLLFVMAAVAVARARQNPIPEKFTNLQALPKSISRPDLVSMMRGFTSALGVRCEHCHVGEGNDLSKFDFVSDVRPAKLIARKMLLMSRAINGPLLEGVGNPPSPGAAKVTCFTCHRGARTPLAGPPPVK